MRSKNIVWNIIFSIFFFSKQKREKISHLICENEKSKKYQEIIQQRSDKPDESKTIQAPKIMKAQWIFKCLTEGKSVNETEFLFSDK